MKFVQQTNPFKNNKNRVFALVGVICRSQICLLVQGASTNRLQNVIQRMVIVVCGNKSTFKKLVGVEFPHPTQRKLLHMYEHNPNFFLRHLETPGPVYQLLPCSVPPVVLSAPLPRKDQVFS